MFTRKSDRSHLEATRAARRALARLSLADRSKRYLNEVDALLGETSDILEAMLDDVDQEGVEADTARTALLEAERAANAGFTDLYRALVVSHNLAQLGADGDGDDYMPELTAYLEGHNPTGFAEASRPERRRIFDKALSYADDFVDDTVVPASVVDGARQAFDAFEDALETLAEEEDDLTDARNVADVERRKARRLYSAARRIAHAALELAEHPRPIGDYMAPLTMAIGRWTTSDDATEPSDAPAEDAQPTPAPDAT